MPAVRREAIPLPGAAPGTERTLTVMRFGTAGARPKAYLQAGLHADELPGMAVLRELAAMLETEAVEGRILGEIVVVPVANPIGLAQRSFSHLQGRYDTGSASNFNRDYPDLAAAVGARVSDSLGEDAADNVATIRSAMAEELASLSPLAEVDVLRHALLHLAHDADIVLDLHADNEAQVHLYTGTPLWPDAQDLAADLDARAVLLAECSGGNPFDEACSAPWWTLAAANPGLPIPPACLAATVELRSNNHVRAEDIRNDTAAVMRFLVRRGLVAGEPAPVPRLLCEATPLNAMQQVIAPAAGIVVYAAALGDTLRAGERVATIVDPLGGAVEVLARTDGRLFARHDQPWAWPGKVIGKIAGATPLAERKGRLLTD
jgi:predicted deacylase